MQATDVVTILRPQSPCTYGHGRAAMRDHLEPMP